MIRSITIHKGYRGQFTNKLYIKNGKPRTFNFTDNVNIITGRNGSGKSVLIKMISKLCCIPKDSTHPVMVDPMNISKGWFSENGYYSYLEYIEKSLKDSGYPKAEIDWDGSMVHRFTAQWFNNDNLFNLMDSPLKRGNQELLGLGDVLSKMTSNHSSGEGGIYILTKLLNATTEYPEKMVGVNDLWEKADNLFHQWIDSMPKDGKPTLLIDELDANLDLDNQKTYWDYINMLAEKWQVIVVSHSYFAFKSDDVNHITLNKEYFNKVRGIR